MTVLQLFIWVTETAVRIKGYVVIVAQRRYGEVARAPGAKGGRIRHDHRPNCGHRRRFAAA
jgi:hypothetical protein